MADRFDNSRARRPVADDGTRHDDQLAEDDPLAELARIVSSNESFDQILGSRSRAAAQPQRGAQQVQRDMSFDLEAELLNDLHSSFDPAQRAPEPRVAPPRQAPQPRAVQPAPRAPEPAPRAPERMDAPLRATRGAAPAPRTMPPPRDAEPLRAAPPSRGAAPEPYGEVPAFVRAPQPPQQRRPAPEPEPDYDSDPNYGDDYLEDEELAGYDDGNLPYDDDQAYEPEPQRRSPKLLITAALVGVVLVAGVLAVFAIKGRSGVSGGAPQVIAADQSPTKIQPPETQQQPTVDAQQNKLIYDRADPDKGSPETLQVPETSTPAADAAQSNETEASREISRIILPGGPDQGSSQDAAPADGSDSGPRKVRTVVVKPDGTIVSSEAAPRGSAQAADNAAAAAPSDSGGSPTNALGTVVADNTGSPSSSAPTGDAGASAKDASQLAPMAAPAPADSAPAQQPQASDAAPAPAADDAPAPEPAPVAKAAPAATGGFVAQLTAQRSEAAANVAYKALQKKYPSILGGQEPNIVKADLGAKGIYYRVRIGPMSTREEAISFCDKLTAAGGQCIVQKN